MLIAQHRHLVPCTRNLAGVRPGARGRRGQPLYSYRQPFLIEPMLEEFTRQTGTKVNVVFAKKGMVEKIKAAGDNNPADAILTVDIGRLDALLKAGLLESVDSGRSRRDDPGAPAPSRRAVVRPHDPGPPRPDIQGSRDAGRARDAGRPRGSEVQRTNLHTLPASTCTTSRSSPRSSPTRVKKRPRSGSWGIRDNLARKPQGNDRAQAKGIYEGVCDVAISNHYYMGKMATNEKKPEQKEWAKSVNVQFLDQNGRGNHVNISGRRCHQGSEEPGQRGRPSGVPRRRPGPEHVRHGQLRVSGQGGDQDRSPWSSPGAAFKSDTLSLQEIANHRTAATKLVDKIGV